MIIDYSNTYVVNALGTMFVFTGGESTPPAPPVEFGPGVPSNITISASARRKGLSGSGGNTGISGSNVKGPIGGNR